MPTVIAKEILEGATYKLSYRGVKATRVFKVVVEGSTDPTFIVAAAALCPDIPAIYSKHPTLPALLCTSIDADPDGKNSPTVMKVILTYEYETDKSKNEPSRNGPCTLEFGTSMASIKATNDSNLNPMILYFDDPVNLKERTQPCEFDIQLPIPTITFRRSEPYLGFDYIALKLAYEGHINSRIWNHGYPHFWMCTLIAARLTGTVYEVEYQFQYNSVGDYGWDGEAVFREPNAVKYTATNGQFIDLAAGAPALEVSIANGGLAKFQLYPEVDFNNLGLFF